MLACSCLSFTAYNPDCDLATSISVRCALGAYGRVTQTSNVTLGYSPWAACLICADPARRPPRGRVETPARYNW